MANKRTFWIVFGISLIIAYLGQIAPERQMPLDFDAMIWRSIPLAILWSVALAFALWKFRKYGLWVLLGGPLALHWPIWLIFNHFPPCYYTHNCI